MRSVCLGICVNCIQTNLFTQSTSEYNGSHDLLNGLFDRSKTQAHDWTCMYYINGHHVPFFEEEEAVTVLALLCMFES